jgi:hypothetical protein
MTREHALIQNLCTDFSTLTAGVTRTRRLATAWPPWVQAIEMSRALTRWYIITAAWLPRYRLELLLNRSRRIPVGNVDQDGHGRDDYYRRVGKK